MPRETAHSARRAAKARREGNKSMSGAPVLCCSAASDGGRGPGAGRPLRAGRAAVRRRAGRRAFSPRSARRRSCPTIRRRRSRPSYNAPAAAPAVRWTPTRPLQEYTDLFIGVGKSEVNLHGSHWLSGFMMDKPLAELRGDLTELGLERRDDDRPARGSPRRGRRSHARAGRRRGRARAGAARRAAAVLRGAGSRPGRFDVATQYARARLPTITGGPQNSLELSWRSNVTRSPWNDPITSRRRSFGGSHARLAADSRSSVSTPSSAPSPDLKRRRFLLAVLRGRRGRRRSRRRPRRAAVARGRRRRDARRHDLRLPGDRARQELLRDHAHLTGGRPCCSRASPTPRPPPRPA